MDVKLVAVEVDHCSSSYAPVLQFKKHGKVVYSGDTLPCQNLKNYAQEAALLIHEGTFGID